MKKRTKFILILFLIILTLPLAAQTSQEKGIMKIYFPTLATAYKAVKAFDILESLYEKGYLVGNLSAREMDELIRLGCSVIPFPEYKFRKSKTTRTSEGGIEGFSCYRTVEETLGMAQNLTQQYPELAEWIDAGDSWEREAGYEGYDLGVLRLTNRRIPGEKPKLFITAALHAREYATAELAARFAEYLVNNYGLDADVTWILDYREIHLMLIANPDGRKQAEQGIMWRKNGNRNYCSPESPYRGADLNRNFAFQWGCCGGSETDPCSDIFRGPYPASEPETKGIQEYMQSIFPDNRGPEPEDKAPLDTSGIYIDLHSHGRLLLWPWGYTEEEPPNSQELRTLGRKLAFYSGYIPQQSSAMYPADGESDDFGYGELGIASYLIELGTEFFESCSYFEESLLEPLMETLLYAAKAAEAPYITPGGPETEEPAIYDDGRGLLLSALVTDRHFNNSMGEELVQQVAWAEFYIDSPPWEQGAGGYPLNPVDGSFDSPQEQVSAYIPTADLSAGPHTLYIQGTDSAGISGTVKALFVDPGKAYPSPPPKRTTGDVNGDGTIDIVDALIIARYYVGLETSGALIENGDADCDGQVNIVDALIVARYYVGLSRTFC